MNFTPAPPESSSAPAYICRHGSTRLLGEFTTGGGAIFPRGCDVLLRTDRGQEIGQVLCPSVPRAVEQLTEPTRGQIVRPLTTEDRQRLDRLREQQKTEYDVGLQLIQQRRLQMELVDVEHLFGSERIIFYFLAEKRIDFRELVKDLARELQTRIELHRSARVTKPS